MSIDHNIVVFLLIITTQLRWVLALQERPADQDEAGVDVDVDSQAVDDPPHDGEVVQEQSKFFQDFFSVQLSPHKMEFGHVCEDPHTWEQRYEQKDYKKHRDMGKVRWGDKNGGYGEHYWDLNPAGVRGNDDDDLEEGPSEDAIQYEEYGKESPRDKRTPPQKLKSKVNQAKKRLRHVQTTVAPIEYRPQEHDYENDDIVTKEPREEPAQYQLTAQNQLPSQIQVPGPDQAFTNQPRLTQNRASRPQEAIQQTMVYNMNPPPNIRTSHFMPYNMPARQFLPWVNTAEHLNSRSLGPRQRTTLYIDQATGHIIDQATGKAYYLTPLLI